jgi:hypothetical protein
LGNTEGARSEIKERAIDVGSRNETDEPSEPLLNTSIASNRFVKNVKPQPSKLLGPALLTYHTLERYPASLPGPRQH